MTHKQANLLGAPLEAGANMYKALQNTYQNSRFSIADGEILYEAIDQYQPETSLEDRPNTDSYSAHTQKQQSIQKQPLPLPPSLDNNEIYDDVCSSSAEQEHHTANTPDRPLLRKAPPPVPIADDIYDHISDSSTLHTAYNMSNKPGPTILDRKPLTPPADDIYDDVENSLASVTPNEPHVQIQKQLPLVQPTEELYEDIVSCMGELTEPLSYEVPGKIQKGSTSKPPVPRVPCPALLYEDPTDMEDYEEI